MPPRLLLCTATLLVSGACGGSSRLEHDGTMQFGDVEVGASRRVALSVTNRSAKSLNLMLASSSPEFVLEEESLTVGAEETAVLLVRFSPADIGPRSGTLTLRSALGVSGVALSGRVRGPRISVPQQVILAPYFIAAGEARAAQTTVVLRNTGTAGSLLTLEVPRVDGAELCVGTFVDSVCSAWVPPAALETQALLEVPLSLLATRLGQYRWSLVFRSNDPVRPEVTTDIVGFVGMPAVRECLVVTPPVLDFGSVTRGCSSEDRKLQLYNVCTTPLTIASAQISSAEFLVVQGISPGTMLLKGPTPTELTLRYRPVDVGADTGGLSVRTLDGRELIIALQGRGEDLAHQVETFHQEEATRSTFFLTSRPSGTIKVLVDTLAVLDSDWAFDAVQDAVVFVTGREPAAGATVEISYSVAACLP